MRYSELAGKEVVDLSEGVRLGAVSSSDLVIDTEQGTVQSMIIYQRAGFFASRNLTLDWASIRKIGRDLIIVDLGAATQEAGLPTPRWGKQPTGGAVGRTVRHRVAGMDQAEKPSTELYAEAPQEEEAPEVTLGWLSRGSDHGSRSLWRRGGRLRSR